MQNAFNLCMLLAGSVIPCGKHTVQMLLVEKRAFICCRETGAWLGRSCGA